MFLALRSEARSGVATITISSAPISVALTQGVQTCGRSTITQGVDLAHRVEHRFVGVGRRVVVAVQHRRRGEERQMIAALDQQAVEQHVVETFRRRQRVGDALAGLVVEVETRRAERQIEIDDRRVDLQLFGDAPADIVRERREPTPPRAPTKATTRPIGAASGIEIEAGDHFDQMQRIERRDQIFDWRRGASVRDRARRR